MKKRQLAQMNKEELIKRHNEIKHQLMIERARIASGAASENTSAIRNLRRELARIKTYLRLKYNVKI